LVGISWHLSLSQRRYHKSLPSVYLSTCVSPYRC
jgi:hypothetical protein